MKITLRRAVISDCADMMTLVRELAIFEKAPAAVTVSLEHFRESGFGKNPVWQAFVATISKPGQQEKLVGLSLFYIRYSTWKGQRLYLEDLIVNEKFRGKGIGKMLFEKTLQEARDLQLNGMTWQVLDWNEPAILFYQKYGANIESGWLNCNLGLP
ncbi:MAG: GNAT family N-acetyltransferase [Bacteroidota bacterium]|nr:GNAT family N-acetyltransferase [Bacteroidota bacterium]MDP4211972.1 GNAT family N-acetyltransferase [Bacteroidota bacterium]